MKKFLRWLAVVIIAVPIVGLAVANRHAVTFSFDPLSQNSPGLSFSLPLFALLLAAVLVGIVIGGVASWFNQGKWRRAARDARAEASHWRHEIQRLNGNIKPADTARADNPHPQPPAQLR